MKKLLMILAIFSLNFLDKPAHSDGHVEKVWETEQIFELPESVIYDATNDVLYVSNITDHPFKKDGTVTAGNSSGINDGAAGVLLTTRDLAEKKNLDIQAKIVSWATSGVDPTLMGLGPIPSSTKALEIAGWSINDLDLIECNEAFAAQTLAVVKELKIPKEKLNVNGGAIAIGHPIGASGARLIVTLIHEMIKRDNKKGLVTLCIGGGMGISMCIARD